MAVNFPNSPAINDIFTSGSSSWKWDGVKWVPLSGSAILTGDGVNILRRNGGLEVWQRGAGGSAAISVPAGSSTYVSDGWYLGTNAGQASVALETAGIVNGSRTACTLRRTAGQTGVGIMYFGFPLDTDELFPMQGKFVRLSFTAMAGANFSPASGMLSAVLYAGSGTPTRVFGGTSYTGPSSPLTMTANLTGAATRYQSTSGAIVPVNTRQAEVVFNWTPVGTAGADDSFTIDDVQLEIVPAATGYVSSDFERLNFEEQLLLCQRHFQKTFAYSVAPANAVGADLNEYQTILGKGGAVTQFVTIRWPMPMRVFPSALLFNPAVGGAAGQMRILSLSADCTGTSWNILQTNMGRVLATSTAAATIGDLIGINYLADAGI
jgi:hypothetical protein